MRTNLDSFVVRAACACFTLFALGCSDGSDDPQTGTGGSAGASGSGGSGGGSGGSGGSAGGRGGLTGGTGGGGSSFTRVWDFSTGLDAWATGFAQPPTISVDSTHITSDGAPDMGALALVDIPFSGPEQKIQTGV